MPNIRIKTSVIGRAQRGTGRAQLNIGRASALPGLYKTTPVCTNMYPICTIAIYLEGRRVASVNKLQLSSWWFIETARPAAHETFIAIWYNFALIYKTWGLAYYYRYERLSLTA